jgi:hypothetical protein
MKASYLSLTADDLGASMTLNDIMEGKLLGRSIAYQLYT